MNTKKIRPEPPFSDDAKVRRLLFDISIDSDSVSKPHLSEETFVARAMGTASPEQAMRSESHLAHCKQCADIMKVVLDDYSHVHLSDADMEYLSNLERRLMSVRTIFDGEAFVESDGEGCWSFLKRD